MRTFECCLGDPILEAKIVSGEEVAKRRLRSEARKMKRAVSTA
jgi:hypothetical protein